MAKPLSLHWILVLGAAIVLLASLATAPGFILILVETPLSLVFGWGWFVARSIPSIRIRWDLVASTLIYTIVLIAGSHFFLRWLYREMSRGPCPNSPAACTWRFVLTLRGFAIVLIMFVAGMAAIGIAHQTAWFVAGAEPSFAVDERYLRGECAGSLTQIFAAMTTYANQHDGRYPDDFRTLISETGYPPEIFICIATSDAVARGNNDAETLKLFDEPHHCSFLYFGKGLTIAAPAETILAAEPLENHRRGIHVLHADRSVNWLDRAEAEQVLARLKTSTPASQPATRP